MEKFTVDLDKVLDEFEYNEDCAEQIVNCDKKYGTSSAEEVVAQFAKGDTSSCRTLDHVSDRGSIQFGYSDLHFSSSFQKTELDGTCVKSTPQERKLKILFDGGYNRKETSDSSAENNVNKKDYTSMRNVSGDVHLSTNKINVSGVFSSLNEYLNAGGVTVKGDPASHTDGSEYSTFVHFRDEDTLESKRIPGRNLEIHYNHSTTSNNDEVAQSIHSYEDKDQHLTEDNYHKESCELSENENIRDNEPEFVSAPVSPSVSDSNVYLEQDVKLNHENSPGKNISNRELYVENNSSNFQGNTIDSTRNENSDNKINGHGIRGFENTNYLNVVMNQNSHGTDSKNSTSTFIQESSIDRDCNANTVSLSVAGKNNDRQYKSNTENSDEVSLISTETSSERSICKTSAGNIGIMEQITTLVNKESIDSLSYESDVSNILKNVTEKSSGFQVPIVFDASQEYSEEELAEYLRELDLEGCDEHSTGITQIFTGSNEATTAYLTFDENKEHTEYEDSQPYVVNNDIISDAATTQSHSSFSVLHISNTVPVSSPATSTTVTPVSEDLVTTTTTVTNSNNTTVSCNPCSTSPNIVKTIANTSAITVVATISTDSITTSLISNAPNVTNALPHTSVVSCIASCNENSTHISSSVSPSIEMTSTATDSIVNITPIDITYVSLIPMVNNDASMNEHCVEENSRHNLHAETEDLKEDGSKKQTLQEIPISRGVEVVICGKDGLSNEPDIPEVEIPGNVSDVKSEIDSNHIISSSSSNCNTLSANMFDAGKTNTSNVTSVISIECQQMKKFTDKNNSAIEMENPADMCSNKYYRMVLNTDSLGSKHAGFNTETVPSSCDNSSDQNVTQNMHDSTLDTRVETESLKESNTAHSVVRGTEERPSRPKFLFLPQKVTASEWDSALDGDSAIAAVGIHSELPSDAMEAPGNACGMESSPLCEEVALTSPDVSETSSIEVSIAPVPPTSVNSSESETASFLSTDQKKIGKIPPVWVPDGHAPSCMLCGVKFTVLKRRHHCRACGKVFCSKCCSQKTRLEYMENAEVRVCHVCYGILTKALREQTENSCESSLDNAHPSGSSSGCTPRGRQPNPNNPMEYCSTIPPLEQAASSVPQPVPSVLVPVGVLKREGCTRLKNDVAKQVIFSDGIRPGGDLTELDDPMEMRIPYRRSDRVLKRVGTPPGFVANKSHPISRSLRNWESKTKTFIPLQGLPPLASIQKGELHLEDVGNMDVITSLKCESTPPLMFALNKNLFVRVKILNLDCCVNRVCWCFSTMGMSCVGQDEIMIVLECLPQEESFPRDIFSHLNVIYLDASRGSLVNEMGHTTFKCSPFLNYTDHGGFMYIRPSFQCLHKLLIPPAPYLVGILIHKWEIPWAKVFPIRLMLRLGAEYRYYPCMLVSVQRRKPVYCEIGHTIMNLLADFRNMSYTLPSVRGMVIHMEDRHTSILLPKNRYDQVTRALNNSNDHVLALAANFSLSADSHLVCIQSPGDDSYHTQAINIHNKPRKVTGASFVVFNGALKMSSNLTAKSSIVEDGIMIQITPDMIQELRNSLRKMHDFTVHCGPAGAALADETVDIKWVQDDHNYNIGVQSVIDGLPLDGVPSIRVHNSSDYLGKTRFIRWTEVFILQSSEQAECIVGTNDPVDISRVSENLAAATCLALCDYLDLLAQGGFTKIAVRVNIDHENVGYLVGGRGEKLPPVYMKSLDCALVPVLHRAASVSPESPPTLIELIFHIMLQ